MRPKEAVMHTNEKFMRILTCSYSGWSQGDPLGEDIYLEPLTDNKIIGEAILKALVKSRDLSISEEDRQLYIDKKITYDDLLEKYPDQEMFEIAACTQRYKEWVQKVMKEYGYKTKKALFQNMQHVSVEQDDNFIKFDSLYHLTIDGWGDPDGKTPSIKLKIPANSSPEIIGAAAKYAIGNCRGKGADFMRNLLFPNGQPASFERSILVP